MGSLWPCLGVVSEVIFWWVVLEKICLSGCFGRKTDVMSFVLYLEGTYGIMLLLCTTPLPTFVDKIKPNSA